MLVEERPCGYDEEEGKSGAAESDVDSQLDVLQKVSDDERNRLGAQKVSTARRSSRRIEHGLAYADDGKGDIGQGLCEFLALEILRRVY